MNHRPYLSLITVSRNDDYGGPDAFSRMELAINSRLEQLEKHAIESELILVDWNPPKDKPLLYNAINWPKNLKYCTTRTIIVPLDIHKKFKYHEKLEIIMIQALNCGIRCARGEFILPSHSDLLYSDELIQYISLKKLDRKKRYRVARSDVNREITKLTTLEEQLDFCRKNVIRVRDFKPKSKSFLDRFRTNLPHLFTSASGDFQLMSRHYWHLLRGYYERYTVGAYVDSLLSYASHAAGVQEVILEPPMCLYHIDHDGQFIDRIVTHKLPLENWLKPSILPERINKKTISYYRRILLLMGYRPKSSVNGIPTLEYSYSRKICRQMIMGKKSNILNNENWGLNNVRLEEHIINRANWDEKK